MALNFDRSTKSDSADDSWKSQAFLNISFPTDTGGKRKVGTINLKDAKDDHKAIIGQFATCKTAEEREAVCAKLLSVMILDFSLAEDPNRSSLKLA